MIGGEFGSIGGHELDPDPGLAVAQVAQRLDWKLKLKIIHIKLVRLNGK